MLKKYNPARIEKKWQKYWQTQKLFNAKENTVKPKKYILVEFPYPSGSGLHVGHMRPYIPVDLTSRYYRAKGFEVMCPFGWDAFGLPAENYAIKMGVLPQVSTKKNISNAKKQIQSVGLSFDWSREVNTTDPGYYKWTQWVFLKFFNAGLAYEATAPINWCPKDKTGLANEEVINGKCERCGSQIEKRNMRQWFLKITAYAEKLVSGLKELDWPDAIKIQQENWIGRSQGAELVFKVQGQEIKQDIAVFTTRPDTLYGATYLVLAPEHKSIELLKKGIKNWAEVSRYIEKSKNKTEIERAAIDKKKTGVQLQGIAAVNPANGEKIPVWVADYVLASYGTGAIMAVPGHDDRDREFAEKFKLPIKQVLDRNGNLMNSGEFDGLYFEQAKKKIAIRFGKPKIAYKLRDWLFSRQRYWGEPIPLIHCEKCGIVPLPEKDLPVLLPKVKKYEPTGTGESPLAAVESWVNVKCPKCGGPGKRETNTMPQWAGSSWYFLRYTNPHNEKEFASAEKLKYWLPVDLYFGGMEHTTLHLLYSRFWNLFLFDQGLAPVAEPFKKRRPHGTILAHDGEKMSKSRGNVVNPDKVIKQYGADTLRLFILFLGPHDQVIKWDDKGVIGLRRFLDRIWKFVHKNLTADIAADPDVEIELNRLIKSVQEDIEQAKFNTAVAAFMEFTNYSYEKKVSYDQISRFLITFAPFAPHISEELWSALGNSNSITLQSWPEFDPEKIESPVVKYVVQVNGKLRATLDLQKGLEQSEVEAKAKEDKNVSKSIASREIKKVVFVPDKLINFVV